MSGPCAIVADLERKQIFHVDLESGDQRTMFVPGVIHTQPLDVAWDPEEERVYWSDLGDYTINSVKIDGSDYKQIYHSPS